MLPSCPIPCQGTHISPWKEAAWWCWKGNPCLMQHSSMGAKIWGFQLNCPHWQHHVPQHRGSPLPWGCWGVAPGDQPLTPCFLSQAQRQPTPMCGSRALPPGISHPEQAAAMGALPMGGLSLGDSQPPAIHRGSQALPPPPSAIGMMVTSNFPPCLPLQDGWLLCHLRALHRHLPFPFTHQGWAGILLLPHVGSWGIARWQESVHGCVLRTSVSISSQGSLW